MVEDLRCSLAVLRSSERARVPQEDGMAEFGGQTGIFNANETLCTNCLK